MMSLSRPKDSSQSLEQTFDERVSRIVGNLARQQPATVEMIRSELRPISLQDRGQHRVVKSIIRLARHFRDKGNYGKLRIALLTGVTYKGKQFLSKFERTGALLSHGQPPKKFGNFLNDFQESIADAREPEWDILQQRLKTYQAYHRLTLAVADYEWSAMQLIKSRPRHIIKQVLALANISFLRSYFLYHVPDELAALLDEMGGAEDAASIASRLVSIANGIKPLDALDLGFPIIGDLTNENLVKLVRYGRVLVERERIAKEISIFGYGLQYLLTSGGDLYLATPPSPDFEYGLRLGYVRMKMSTAPSAVTNSAFNSSLDSLKTAAAMLFDDNSKGVAEIRDADIGFPRIRLKLPISPSLYQALTEMEFYEDVLSEEHLLQDFLLPLRSPSGEPAALTASMTVAEFLRVWRLLQFISLVDIESLFHYQQAEPTATQNSVIRVMKERDLIEMITTLGVEPERAREFISLVAANVNSLGHYDLQYRPLLQIAAVDFPEEGFRSPVEFVLAPAVVATANILRNVQIANQVRLRDLPQQFVEIVAKLFRQHFSNVIINRRVKVAESATEIDVVLLHGNNLFLFECKHSVFPCDLHEVRDAWGDIEKGVGQLQLAARILADYNRCRDYLAGWFPNWRPPQPIEMRIVPCVISSNRIFSGIHHDGVAIRDYASLYHLAVEGVASIGLVEDDGSILLRRFRINDVEVFKSADLLDYVSPESRYFKTFGEFMQPISRLARMSSLTVAHETYVYQLSVDEWIEHMEAMGYDRLPDLASTIQLPRTLEQVLKDLEQQEASE